MYYKAIKDEESYNYVLRRLNNDIDNEIKEFIDIISNEDSDKHNEWYEEMKDNLEGI